jgi:hypothetical protein
MMIAPAREGTLRLSDLFVPHSEHRIVPTLALCLGLEQWSGQWDGRVECVAGAVIHAAVIVLLVAYVFHAYSPGAAVASGWLQLGLGLSALDWENTLVGFQSQFYFLIGFSLLAIWGLLDPRGWRTVRWWAGLLGGALALISMGSGLLCFIPVAAIAAGRLLWRRGPPAIAAVALAAAAGGLGLGWLARGTAPWDDATHAKSLADFLSYGLHCLAWPARSWPALAALAGLPWLYLAIRRFGRYSARQELLVAGGIWVWLQIAAVSFYRGAGGGYPADRYADIFAIGVAINFLTWFEVEPACAKATAGRLRLRPALFALWILVIAAGAALGGRIMWTQLLPSVAGRSRVYEENVGLYLRTGDAARLHPPHQIPFPDVDWFKRIVDRPALRAVMPVSVRQPAWESSLSAAVRHFCRAGIWLCGAGILLLLRATVLTWRRTE